jgi:hypothetical protein
MKKCVNKRKKCVRERERESEREKGLEFGGVGFRVQKGKPQR